MRPQGRDLLSDHHAMTVDPLSPLSPTAASERTAPASAAPAAPVSATDAGSFADLLAAQNLQGAARAQEERGERFFHQSSHSGELKPLQKFESFFLRNFVETMLPQKDTSFFGSGTAGQIWKSMLAERIGDEMAASGGIGIADMLAKREPGGPDKS
ncbi:rod-binding protein [Aureimonas sp. D3]|uniref:rod-binding protein n=1 Tax=Aureimonas sp. D3 TaxID=1638164 RepID=UPI000784627D|nr:rod-binding protein [Aureimonas sp. D3]